MQSSKGRITRPKKTVHRVVTESHRCSFSVRTTSVPLAAAVVQSNANAFVKPKQMSMENALLKLIMVFTYSSMSKIGVYDNMFG